jgi:signal transduction histidine kinase
MARAGSGRALGGVAAGLAEHLGLRPLPVRAAFVLLALFGGMGVALYAALWLLVPMSAARGPRRTDDRVQLLALSALGIGGLLLLQGAGITSPAVLPLLFVGGGVALVWRQVAEAPRQRWRSARGRGPLVVLTGAVLVAAGMIGFLASRGELQQAREGLVSTVVVVLGLALLTGPWWLRMAADLRDERRERIRSQERAEVAAHVHDSVLQTLALIRKAAEDPREVSRLARTQERELRGWLYAPGPVQASTVAGGLEAVAAEVEEAHGVAVEVVVVGDCPTSPALQALVAAAREALVNAAKHAGVDTVSLYAEVTAGCVEVFVRDRGCGFDAAAVPADRFGVSQSVVGRMERHGGKAVVRSTPGSGTEVRLEVSRP